jgi:hypothetical protein
MPQSLATWEEVEDLRRRFSSSPALGQDGFQGGRNVMNKNGRRRARKHKALHDPNTTTDSGDSFSG